MLEGTGRLLVVQPEMMMTAVISLAGTVRLGIL